MNYPHEMQAPPECGPEIGKDAEYRFVLLTIPTMSVEAIGELVAVQDGSNDQVIMARTINHITGDWSHEISPFAASAIHAVIDPAMIGGVIDPPPGWEETAQVLENRAKQLRDRMVELQERANAMPGRRRRVAGVVRSRRESTLRRAEDVKAEAERLADMAKLWRAAAKNTETRALGEAGRVTDGKSAGDAGKASKPAKKATASGSAKAAKKPASKTATAKKPAKKASKKPASK